MQDIVGTAGGGDVEQSPGPGNSGTRSQFPVEFSGKTGEFFKIWIVNLFLTIITMGIYSAWAKVRTRRYFYANTSIDGHPFDYLAKPVNILIGHLIVGSFFIAYSLSGRFAPQWSIGLMIFFYLVLPYLILKSIRFYTHNSAYRGIRFKFYGTLWESYQLYLLTPILIPLTLGLYFPYWVHLQKRWFFENTAYGSTLNSFTGRPGIFYKTYIFAFLQVILMVAVFFLIIGMATYFTGTGFEKDAVNPDFFMKAGIAGAIVMYIVVILGTAIVQQYVFARITNYCWQKSLIGPVKVASVLKARKLFWIRFSNIIAIVFSIGLLIPWARVRRMKYITGCMQVSVSGSFDEFASTAGHDVSAVGDAATDFFDFDIGL